MRASALVMAVLAVLSAAAYLVARGVLYGRLHERLERAARSSDLRQGLLREGYVVVSGSGAGPDEHVGFTVAPDARYGALAVLRWAIDGHTMGLLATSARDDVQALETFLAILAGLTLAGGVVALPGGYLLAGRALHPLDQAVQERAEFIALASHRLRTPLSVIRTSAELALAGQGLAAPEALRTIVDQTARMERLAERLTALARAESRPWTSAPGAVELDAVARQVVDELRPAAAQSGVVLRLDAARPVPVAAPAADTADMLSSVLENALRFTPAGRSVRVRAAAQGRWALLEVADEGPGIDPADLPRVAEPFFQGRRVRGATGLGLAITRAIADRLGGRLHIASAPGAGTTVRILLPAGGRAGRPARERGTTG